MHNLHKCIFFNVFVLVKCDLVCLRSKVPRLIICVIENFLSLNSKFFFIYTVSIMIGYHILILLNQYLQCNKMKRVKKPKGYNYMKLIKKCVEHRVILYMYCNWFWFWHWVKLHNFNYVICRVFLQLWYKVGCVDLIDLRVASSLATKLSFGIIQNIEPSWLTWI